MLTNGNVFTSVKYHSKKEPYEKVEKTVTGEQERNTNYSLK